MSTPDYYCHPIFHRDPISDVSSATGYWLVTSQEALAPGPGVYTSWYIHVSPGTGRPVLPSAKASPAPERSSSSLTSSAITPGTNAPAITACIFETLHFAVRGGETIYSDITSAFVHYQGVVDNGGNAELLATRSYMKAFYFAQGANEWTAERLALEATPETANNLPPPSSPHPRGGIVYPVTPST
ncbi:hypothetical protein C8F04DRAFT_1280418, partial [Mycena alexandri]